VAINYFIGWGQQDLESELRIAQEDLAAGKTTVQAQGGESRIGSQVQMTPQERIKMILKALNLLDPEAYPIASVSSMNTTRACFSDQIFTSELEEL
jgi:hypothetical protein